MSSSSTTSSRAPYRRNDGDPETATDADRIGL
jgi:hypothetical protein